MPSPTLAAIHIHPVKSCRAVALDEATVAETGLAGDRLFQVIGADGAPITQRQHRVLATVQPTLVDGGLRLEADAAGAVEVVTPSVADRDATNLLGMPIRVGDAGDEAADWFTSLLGEPARLVALTADHELVIPGFGFRTSLADAAPVLIANEASAAWLVERASEAFGIDRFRPNLTVEGVAPWDEETWRRATIGAVEATLALPWPRCAIPQIDQQTAERHQEPARVLRAHRWCAAGSLDDPALGFLEGNGLFGMASSLGPVGTTVRVGDPVTVTDRGPALLAPPE